MDQNTMRSIYDQDPVFTSGLGLDLVISLSEGQIMGMEEVENIREKHGLSLVDWMKKALA